MCSLARTWQARRAGWPHVESPASLSDQAPHHGGWVSAIRGYAGQFLKEAQHDEEWRRLFISYELVLLRSVVVIRQPSVTVKFFQSPIGLVDSQRLEASLQSSIEGRCIMYPRSLADLTASNLSQALSLDPASITSVETEVIGQGVGILCQLARVKLSYRGDARGPKSVIAKFPAAIEQTRGLARQFKFYEREVNF